jgi:hypothetical protein
MLVSNLVKGHKLTCSEALSLHTSIKYIKWIITVTYVSEKLSPHSCRIDFRHPLVSYPLPPKERHTSNTTDYPTLLT